MNIESSTVAKIRNPRVTFLKVGIQLGRMLKCQIKMSVFERPEWNILKHLLSFEMCLLTSIVFSFFFISFFLLGLAAGALLVLGGIL